MSELYYKTAKLLWDTIVKTFLTPISASNSGRATRMDHADSIDPLA
jgi:hypothetical protein